VTRGARTIVDARRHVGAIIGSMFARVITADAGAEGIDAFLEFARRQLSGADQLPGFAGYYVLTNADTGKVVVVSLWETREQMDAVADGQPGGIRGEGVPAPALASMTLETYEVASTA
jgi:hypothetical protein